MNKNNDEVVLSFHETLLRKSDVALLERPRWLNDKIISFYFEFLEHVVFPNNQDLLFVGPEVTQCLKIVSAEEIGIFLEPLKANIKLFIFFPINDNEADEVGGSHWSLLVFSRPEQAFYHFDSLNSGNQHQSIDFVRRIKKCLDAPNVVCKTVDCAKQSNGYDCGIHVLCNAENVAHHVVEKNQVEGVPLSTTSMIMEKRFDILNVIKKLQQS